jgi:integrase
MLTTANPSNVESSVTDPQRPKDFLDPTEIKSFLEAAKATRNGVRDHLLFLMLYRHGLRCSEAIDLRRDDVSFDRATLWVRRSTPSWHCLRKQAPSTSIRCQTLSTSGPSSARHVVQARKVFPRKSIRRHDRAGPCVASSDAAPDIILPPLLIHPPTKWQLRSHLFGNRTDLSGK